MTTLRRLLAVPGLGLRVLAGAGEALDRAVGWVAVSELADPTPYLEGGELVLLTGVGVRLDGPAARDYVDRLVARGVAAVGFGVGVVHDAVPPALVSAATEHGLPLLEVDQPTPFIAVGKALADLLAAEQSERGRRRVAAMRSLTAVLAGGAEPIVALRRLAGRLGGWVAVLDGHGDVTLAAGSPARADVAAGLARQVRSRRERGPGTRASAAASDEAGRTAVLPLGVGGRAHGYLAVATPPGVEPDHSLVAFAASLLTLDGERARGARPALRWARAAALAGRLGAPVPAPPADVLGPLADDAASVVAVHVAEPPAADLLAALDDDERVAALPAGPAGTLLVVAASDVGDLLATLTGLPGVRAGVSRPVAAAGVGPAAREAASLAARSRAGLLRAQDAAPTRRDLLDPAAARAFADAVLGPLAAAGASDAPVLAGTLACWLRANAETGVAAAELGIHRHTLRERLRRAARLLGVDLDDAAVRVDLWVALEARGELP